MDFGFSEDQKMIQASIRDFLDKECPSDKVRELEATEKGYDPEIWQKMADLGYLGIHLPEEYQGTGGDFLDLMILMEEMGRKLLPHPSFQRLLSVPSPCWFTAMLSTKRDSFLTSPVVARSGRLLSLSYLIRVRRQR